MAGEAKTNKFMLGAATVMIGAQADLLKLVKTTHSIGLVKNFTLTGDFTYTELTQGVKNVTVDSALTNSSFKAAMEGYEATPENLRYALGLEKGTINTGTLSYALIADIGVDDLTFKVGTSDLTAEFVSGDWVNITDGDENVWIAKVASSSFDATNTVVTVGADYGSPAIFTAADSATKVLRTNVTAAGQTDEQPYLAAKVVGKLSNGDQVTLLFPKLRVVSGFNLAFVTDNYGNLPIEFTPYQQTSSDPMWGKLSSNDALVDIYT